MTWTRDQRLAEILGETRCLMAADEIQDQQCPMCGQPAAEHESAAALERKLDDVRQITGRPGRLAFAADPPRHRRWLAENRRTRLALGNVSLLGALRFWLTETAAGRGPVRIRRWR